MKRRALKLLLFLSAGAIINVAVAWGLALTWKCESSIGVTDSSGFVPGGHTGHLNLQTGLPLRTVHGTSIWNDPGEIHLNGLWKMNWPFRRVGFILLPFKLIWPGFAINTIFYAAIVWMMVAVPGTIKRIVGGGGSGVGFV